MTFKGMGVTSCRRQEGSSAQSNFAAGVGANFRRGTLSDLFEAYLNTTQFDANYSGHDENFEDR